MLNAQQEVRRAIHRGESDLPFVEFGEGLSLQLLQVDLDQGLWIVRTRLTYLGLCAANGVPSPAVIVGAH